MSVDERELPTPEGETAAARVLVPSDRERAAGTTATGEAPPTAPGPGAPTGRHARRTLREAARDLDPREVTRAGPAFPLVVLGLGALITQWDDQAIGVLLPEIRADFRVDLGFILTLQAFLTFGFQVTRPVFGYLADRLSRVWILRVGQTLGNASTLLTGMTGSVGGFVGTRFGQTLGNAVVEPVGLPLLADVYPSRVRARVFSILTFAGQVGQIVGPIMAGVLGALYGWRPAVIALGATALAVTGLTYLLREPVRGYQDRKELGASEEVARREQPPMGWTEAWRASRSVATIRRLWYAAPFVGIVQVGTIQLVGFYYAEEFGVGSAGRGLIGSLGIAIGLPALLVFGPWADRIIARRPGRIMTIMGAGMVAQAGAFVVLSATPSFGLAVGVNLVLAAISVLFLPAFFTVMSLAVPARIRGLGTMSVGPFLALGMLAGALIAGAVQETGGLRSVFLLFTPAPLVAALILGTASGGVGRDLRAARAAALAEETSRRAREAGAAKLLVCRDVSVHYDGVQVLDAIDLDVGDGEIVALLGTNGAGKSTLLRAIAGVTEASGGAIFFDDRDITHAPPHEIARAGVVMLPGGRAIFPTLTVEENLRAAALHRPDADPEEVLAMFPALRERLETEAGSLSGGEQQMLALGQAFLMRPRLLAIDELSLGLSPKVVAELLETLRRIHAAGTTVILVEQSVNLALTIAARAVFMEKGRIVYDGPAEELAGRGDVLRSIFLGGAVTGKDLTRPADRRRRDEARIVLQAEDLTVRFGGVTGLDGVSLRLAEREVLGIIGANGAGKTTLFDALSGFAPVAGGHVLLDGADVTGLRPDERARLGLTRSFQHVRLFPTMTVREAVAVAFERHLDEESALKAIVWAPKLRALERRHARRVDNLLGLLGLREHADKYVSELSTAMRRIADLACVTATEPTVLLLDEPSSGLAQAEAEELGPLLRRLVRETGCALAIIEHDIPLVAGVSDRMIAMDLGRVIAEGAAADVLADEAVARAALGGRDDVIRRTDTRKA